MQAGELIRTLLDPLFSNEVYADFIPERSAAAVVCVYQYISAVGVNTLDSGYTNQDACRIQVDVYAQTAAAAHAKAAEVIAAIDSQTTLPALYLGKRTIPEPETRYARVSIDFSIWENTP